MRCNFQQAYVGTKMTKRMFYTQCKDYQNTDEEPNLKFRCILGSFSSSSSVCALGEGCHVGDSFVKLWSTGHC